MAPVGRFTQGEIWKLAATIMAVLAIVAGSVWFFWMR
jgi:hypothetical protein